jgi:hypothetical protein
LILHYYPDLIEDDVLSFYSETAIEANTLRGIGYVKQIIGE